MTPATPVTPNSASRAGADTSGPTRAGSETRTGTVETSLDVAGVVVTTVTTTTVTSRPARDELAALSELTADRDAWRRTAQAYEAGYTPDIALRDRAAAAEELAEQRRDQVTALTGQLSRIRTALEPRTMTRAALRHLGYTDADIARAETWTGASETDDDSRPELVRDLDLIAALAVEVAEGVASATGDAPATTAPAGPATAGAWVRARLPLAALVTTERAMQEVLARYDAGARSESPDEPIWVGVRADLPGRFEVKDGHLRAAAALRAGRDSIVVDIDTVADDEPYEAPFFDFADAVGNAPA